MISQNQLNEIGDKLNKARIIYDVMRLRPYRSKTALRSLILLIKDLEAILENIEGKEHNQNALRDYLMSYGGKAV